MIKKILLFVVCIWGLTFYAQDEQSKNQIFVGAGANSSSAIHNFSMQVGSPILLKTHINGTNTTTIGFPFGVLYVPNTFVSNRYKVSKGYYPDRIQLSWQIGANEDRITRIQIFRKEVGIDTAEQLIATLAKDVFEYNDYETEGGVLYEYKIKADGVSESENREFFNFVTGIGYRNPTATVTGNISFEGGNAVKDVTVFAEAVGASNTSNTSVRFNDNVFASTGTLSKTIKAQNITLQAWQSVTINDFQPTIFKSSTNKGSNYEIISKITVAKIFVVDVLFNGNYLANLHLRNSIPTGEIDAFGNDIYKNITDLTTDDFFHFSATLEKGKQPLIYINGRPITPDAINSAVVPDDVLQPSITFYDFSNYNPGSDENIQQVDFCTSCSNTYLDEIRVWERTLTASEIRGDYRRFLSGGENGLKIYLRGNEKAGDFLYDLSKTGSSQNENHAQFVNKTSTYEAFSTLVPEKRQLGVFGVTDENGGYNISAIPYAGTGETFKVTPSLGVHKFEPASQTLFLGKDEPVANKIDFVDVSSFQFNGRVVYNVQDVFDPIVTTNPTNLRDFGYNKYSLGGTIINKGEYYYEGGSINGGTGFYEGGSLKQYPVIGVGEARVLIDGNPVFDADNQPVVTNADGTFTVQVPIGNHKVEVEKAGHTFALNGRFPEKNTFQFFEDQTETQYFIDATRVTLVGKVVGGKKEFEKKIGFGFDGKYEFTNFEDLETEVKETISSNNNIGVAQITFKGDANSNTLNKIILTNEETGEYKVALIPYQYSILQNGITIPTNTDISVLTSTETLDLRTIPDLKTTEFTTKDETVLNSEPYHYVKSFRYNSDVAVYLLEQEFDTIFTIDNKNFDISGLNTPIYTQKENYKITFEVIQEYINNDADEPVKTKEFFTEGAFNITNNLSQSDTQRIVLKDNNTKYEYSFNAGLPNITLSDNFAQSINVQYIIEGSNPLSITNLSDFKNNGIVKGGKPSEGKTFVTSAPEVPEVILRDPPGTNSFATIEKGTSIKMKVSKAESNSDTTEEGFFFSIGPDVTFSKGVIFASVDTQIDVVADTDFNFSRTTENTSENETEITYTFNQAISTSDSPSFVGADGDLFIGNAKNIYYGIFDNIFITENIPLDLNNAIIPNLPITVKDEDGNDKSLYISTSKDYFIAEQPTNTFFTYSQKYIVDTLIPELERLAATGTSTSDGVEEKSATYYTAQADLWRKVVQNNEKAKYDAKNNREAVKNGVIANVVNNFDPSLRSGLTALVNENFYSNRSFDAGLGEFKNSISTSVLTSNTYSSTIDIEDEFAGNLGLFVNGVGRSLSYTKRTGSVDTDSNTTSQDISNTISYTLKDNDKSNLLSVDVVSMFDGNGPVFITRGGTTSCPYEGETTSIFFKNDGFDANVIGVGGEVLSEATNKVYNAEISVEKNLITNVPESESAIFKVFLKNTSETQTDLEFILDFDSTSLNGAEINLETNGTSVFLPFNETIEFPIEISKTSSSSRYKYEDIKLLLYSPCAFASERDEISIEITAEFKKSCSNVVISVPENNFIFNNNEAYSLDINGNTTTNILPITFTDFNVDFTGFQKIELQYRNASASNWSKFASYYGSEALKTTAGDTEGIVIGAADADFTYNWDIVGDNIPDGNYEIRAVSYCTDDITNTSDIISGIINLNAPLVFGTPKPTDGILDVGEDVSIRFNEPIFERTATNITVTGLRNQQTVNHNVSVYLDGSNKKIELPNQRLPKGSFTLQFWFNNATTGVGNLVSQEDGINIAIDENHLTFSIDGAEISTKRPDSPINGSQYNFYSFVYQNGNQPQLLIFENGLVLESQVIDNELDINTAKSIFIGDENVLGTIHDIRLWARTFTPAQANVAKDLTLSGRELNLLGYWKLDEGFGTTGLDIAKRKNAIVNLDWTIFPKGTGYEFENNSYLSLNSVGFVQPTNSEDITLSFWMKTATTNGTIFSNGVGDDSEFTQTNGFRNKWSINLKNDGNLELMTENTSYDLTTQSVADNSWHHIALVLKRGGTLNSYVDANQVTSVSSKNIGGFSGNKILLGAKLNQTNNTETFTNHYTGLLDEVRFWNTARPVHQLQRDRYFEIDKETEGLQLYVDFNESAQNTSNGPAYNHADRNLTTGTTFAILSSGSSQNYTQDSPALKPQLQFTNIPFSTVINGDEMIISPELTAEEWALFEGQTLNFSVSRMSDTHFNNQKSPVNWAALVNRQELEWFTEDQSKEIITEKNVGETYSFIMNLVNIGGSNQPYTISGIPTWMQTDKASGNIPANTSREITFTVDTDLAMGNYTADLFLQTSSGFNDRLTFNLRALQPAPDWSVNPREFNNSINIIGQIQISNQLSRDKYTKVGAFVNNQKRGEAYLRYDKAYDSYFVFLTAYSNTTAGEIVTFKIWDAINGKSLIATLNGNNFITFLNNQILGTKSSPQLFSGDNLTEQSIALNTGWSWTSFFVDDARFTNLPQLLTDLTNFDEVTIQNDIEDTYLERGNWKGQLETLSASEMYKIKISEPYTLKLSGTIVDETNLDFPILQGWNWLPFPIHKNISLEEALAFYNPTDGDVIKDQFNFAIYDAASGWSGTLNYLVANDGYMLRSGLAQTFNYPDARNTAAKTISSKKAPKNNVDHQFRQYQFNMNVVAEIVTDEIFESVLIYDIDGNLRGKSEITEIDNRYFSFLTAFSNNEEPIRFALVNSTNEIQTEINTTFQNNLVLGNLKEPFQIGLKALSTNNFNLNSFAVYPNPFTNTIQVNFTNTTSAEKVEIYSVLGVLLNKQKVEGLKKATLDVQDLAIGVYMLKVTSVDGKTITKKLIKK